ncbi:CIC11C00000003231 [Sungouiella intermedia]|uniref:CIC11C00000003231 n=1 Tax=Sungouiella intermedia TaxID=45354 RepID=A0A1L0BT93_9ASCO|nr:CIC11C00000003231 [[Candida] intermedia]
MEVNEDMSYPYGRLHLPDDDNTFAPPPLSAYSIALLSDHVSSGFTVKPSENLDLKTSLKNKLSVHFLSKAPGATSEQFGQTAASGINGNSANSAMSSINANSANTNTGTIGISGNISQNLSSHNLTSHNLSGNNLSHSTSGHSTHNTSNTSIGSSFNAQQDEDPMDVSGENLAKSSQAIAPGGSLALGKLLARPHSNGFSGVKRSRLARRFRSLGPPKRASEVPEPLEEVKTEPIDSPVLDLGHTAEDSKLQRPKRLLPISPDPSTSRLGKTAVTSNLDFFKTLEKLKLRSPVLESGSGTFGHVSPPRHEGPSHESNRRFDASKSSSVLTNRSAQHQENPFQRPLLSRPPLHEIAPHILNSERKLLDFKKPINTKPYSVEHTPFASKQPASPLHASFHSTASSEKSISESKFNDEGKRKKIIQINSQQYEKLELLGRGGTSKVYKVRSLATKQTLAIKKVSFDQFDDSCVKGFKGEIDLLIKLKNEPRVVKLVDHSISDGSIFLVMECGDLDLARVLQTKLSLESKLDFNFVKFHAMEILRCVEAVHRAGIVHSDLKPANFLFVKGVMKIIDFGIANAVPDHTANIYRESQIGTPNYMAPEALVDVNHSFVVSKRTSSGSNTWKVGRPSDIWSCGCMIYQMIYGKPPYGSYSGQLRIMAIMNPQVKIDYPSTGIGGVPVPLSCIELMQKCLTRNPNERWTVEQCMNSDFLRPKSVSREFVKDLVYSAVNFGSQNKIEEITDDVYEKLVETVLRQIEDLNYA